MLRQLEVDGSFLFFDDQHGPHTAEYYYYCCKLIVTCLEFSSKKINVILGSHNPNITNELPVSKLDMQLEHTLVKRGGRSVDEIIEGSIPTDTENDKYLVRIANYDYYKTLDGVVEYSIPNIINMKSCATRGIVDYSKKCFYIAPLLYDIDRLDESERSGVFTLFSLGTSPRRDAFHYTTGIQNISNIFSSEELKTLYYNKAILVNLHQTDHHHTFEELRVLPALSQGIVVIAEDSPLKKHIPYSKSIVWSNLQDMEQTIKDVENNYEDYRNKLITPELKNILKQLRKDNLLNMSNLIWQNKI
jgi:hypothetical protein